MNPENSDLQALAAAAHGRPRRSCPQRPGHPTRAARIAELKARYEAGDLQVDEEALAAKIVDLLFEQ